MMDKYEAVVRDSTMCGWRGWGQLLIAERKVLFSAPCLGHDTKVDLDSDLSSDLGLGMLNRDEFRLGMMFTARLIGGSKYCDGRLEAFCTR